MTEHINWKQEYIESGGQYRMIQKTAGSIPGKNQLGTDVLEEIIHQS